MASLIQTLQDILNLNGQFDISQNAEFENILVLLRQEAELKAEVQQLASRLEGIRGDIHIKRQILSTEMERELALRNACSSALDTDDNEDMEVELPRGDAESGSLAGLSAFGLHEGDPDLSDNFAQSTSLPPSLDHSRFHLGGQADDFDMMTDDSQSAMPEDRPFAPVSIDEDPMATVEAMVHGYIETHTDSAFQIAIDATLDQLLPIDHYPFNFTTQEKAVLMVLYEKVEDIHNRVLGTDDYVWAELDRLKCHPHPILAGLFSGVAHRVKTKGAKYQLLQPVDTQTAKSESIGILKIIALVESSACILLGGTVPWQERQTNGLSLGHACAWVANALRDMKDAWRKYMDARSGRNGH
ncbi:hypothetical protein FRB90_004824 [Tulasnella sp. 427]|nr:hypothetical protein FRB90_004824 [Tulasnella sp. 427]